MTQPNNLEPNTVHTSKVPIEHATKTMRLRGDPPRVTRLSRKVLVGLGLVSSLCLGGALIYALQTGGPGKSADELYSTENRATADGLAGLPRDYSAIPKLGPPLPGDLGRPMLAARNNGVPVPNPLAVDSGPSAEEQRQLQEIETARISKLFATTESRPTQVAPIEQASARSPARRETGDAAGNQRRTDPDLQP